MALARLERDHSRFRVIPRLVRESRERVAPEEWVSDAWPDWSAEVGEIDLTVAGKNRPSVVLREAAWAVVYSVGLVVFLMAVLNVLHIR